MKMSVIKFTNGGKPYSAFNITKFTLKTDPIKQAEALQEPVIKFHVLDGLIFHNKTSRPFIAERPAEIFG